MNQSCINEGMNAKTNTRMSASASLLQRPISEDILRDQTAQLATPQPTEDHCDTCSALIFRLAGEWFALAASLCQQVLSPLPAHTLPHRSNSTLLGVVNVRGQMLLKVSFLDMLELDTAGSREECRRENSRHENSRWKKAQDSGPLTQVYARMVVIEKAIPVGNTAHRDSGVMASSAADVWVFEVDELDGIHSVRLDALEAPAAGVQGNTNSCIQRVFLWRDRRVNFLDQDRLFETLRRRAL